MMKPQQLLGSKLNQEQLNKRAEAHVSWLNKTGGYAKDISLRDYFAAKALQGLLSCEVQANKYAFARRSYEVADAMLEVRNAAQ